MSPLMEPLEYKVLWEQEDRHWWFVGMRQIFRQFAGAYMPDRAYCVLDVGCGTGGMLREFASWRGVRAFGLDRSELAVALARRRTPAPLALGDIGGLPFRPASFDLVTSFDVLQNLHHSQQVAAVSETHRVVKPGGLFFVRCPAFPSLRGCHSVHVGDLYRFRLEELRRLLEGAGFELIRASYANALLFPIAWFKRRVLEPAGVARTHTDILPVPGWVNYLLARVLAVEALWLRRAPHALPFGLSVICLARKPETQNLMAES